MAAGFHRLTEPYDHGMLDVGDGHQVFWQQAGNPEGKPAVLLHGGPGGGISDGPRRLFDPDRYRIVQFDQRQCGRSMPYAGDSSAPVDLSANTTAHLVADIERLRSHLGIDRWLVWGGSWGTTLGLAYALDHRDSVSELVLASVVTTSAAEVEWITRSMSRIFPEEWKLFVEALPPDQRDGNLALAYNRLVLDPDPAVHQPAADAWCRWEDVHVSIAAGAIEARFTAYEPEVRLCITRLVTHYWGNAGFLPDGELLARAAAGRLEAMPVFLAHGRRDISGPADIAVALADSIRGAELYIDEAEGHGGPSMSAWVKQVTDRLVA